jgi:peptidoglycan/LPS O-acetylase OafA/YrhL
VEEQFYILFPLIFLLSLHRYENTSPLRPFAALLGLTLASMCLSWALTLTATLSLSTVYQHASGSSARALCSLGPNVLSQCCGSAFPGIGKRSGCTVSSPGSLFPFPSALLSIGGTLTFLASGHCVNLEWQSQKEIEAGAAISPLNQLLSLRPFPYIGRLSLHCIYGIGL